MAAFGCWSFTNTRKGFPKARRDYGRGFTGYYFALAISTADIYTLSVSTHYPAAGVVADDGSPIYYQQQVLAKVPRTTFGGGY